MNSVQSIVNYNDGCNFQTYCGLQVFFQNVVLVFIAVKVYFNGSVYKYYITRLFYFYFLVVCWGGGSRKVLHWLS